MTRANDILTSGMTHVPSGAPWSERGGRLRGVVDLVAGRYPPFLFGLPVGRRLPVFHFHEETPEVLEPALQYLAENGYRTVASEEVTRIVRRQAEPAPRTVLLAFDDAWASLWLVVAPLLRRYGMRAVAYAIPSRIREAAAVRPTLADGPLDASAADRADNPFVTWPELRALSSSGVIDVQSHTWSHAMIFCGTEVIGRVDQAFAAESVLNHPRLNDTDPPVFLTAADRGAPLYPRRSRMSDARRYFPDDAGGSGHWETPEAQQRAIEHELVAARDVLEARLGTPVRHVCLPWGVAGQITRRTLTRMAVETAFSNRLRGGMAVSPGDDAYSLKRLHSRHIRALPGRGRRPFVTLA